MLSLFAALLIAQAHVHPDGGHGVLDKDAPKPTGTIVDLKLGDQTSRAYVARPKQKATGAILVIHEWWGLNDRIKHQADELAGQGYAPLAVDLYKGKRAKDANEAMAL